MRMIEGQEMPASGETGGRMAAARLRCPGCAAALLLAVTTARPAAAATPDQGLDAAAFVDTLVTAFSREETAVLTLVVGIVAFALTVSILHLRARRQFADKERKSSEQLGELKARVERAEGLLEADQQILVVWDPAGDSVKLHCDPGASRDLPQQSGDVLAFGKWLSPESAGELDYLVERLRRFGEAFNVMLKTRGDGYIEADGRIAAGRAVLRFRDLAGQRRELAEIYHRHKQLVHEVERLRTLLGELPMPAWMRNSEGQLTWANPAYARLAGSGDVAQAVEANAILVDGAAQPPAADRPQTESGAAGCRRLPAMIEGETRLLDLFESHTREGSAGIAIDVTEVEANRKELVRREIAHARTLDNAATGVAVFDADQRVVFHNAAFRSLWGLDADYLADQPEYGEILDHLRAQGRLPEQADYREWRRRQLAEFDMAGAEAEPDERAVHELWHLPDGRILRVTRTPHPGGGLGCLYDDVSETVALESRLDALTRVQRETLDSLAEGIAVFGSDGRLKLSNRRLGPLWGVAQDTLEDAPHVEDVIGWCRALHDDEAVWSTLHGAVTGFADSRESVTARLERGDGTILDLHVLPLPDGATLVVFADVTDSARIEKALRDRNEALMAAARVKNEFVHKVSYELRAPLTNIIGFAHLMSEEATGSLNERQRDYVDHILNSSGALLAIINDILDLATIDAGVMELEVGNVDIADAVRAAVEAIRDRTVERGVTIELDMAADIGSFKADEKRVRQVLFNLLSNAVGFSEAGQIVRLSCRRSGTSVIFSVADEGPGIPDEVRRSVFDRFESHALGTRHSGVGLGLSIVKSLVELHGGRVELDTEAGRGTTLTCLFPERAILPDSGPGSGDAVPEIAAIESLPGGSPPVAPRDGPEAMQQSGTT